MNIFTQLPRTHILMSRYNGSISTRRLSFSFQLPEKYKGTRIEKWYMYWKTLLQDYKEVGKDTAKDIRTKPFKAFVIFSSFVFAGCSHSRNPDEKSYRDSIINYANDVLLVGDKIRNEKAVNYMKYVENCNNTDILRYFSLGLLSIVYKSNHDKYSGLYEAQCSYTQTPYLQFHKQIVDIGFWNKWWILEREMKDYDVSPTEWPELMEDQKENKTLSTGLFYNFPLWPARENKSES